MATAYVRGVLKTLREGKSIGSYAVKWTNLPDSLKSSTAYRLGAYPETEFRSQLAAIREALKEGKKKNLTDITIVTDAKFFPYFYRNGWKTSRGETVANKYFYDQICELVEDFNEVKFRHEVPKNNETWKELEKKCEEGFHCTIPTVDTSEYKLSIEQITHDPKQFEGTGIARVRYFVNKPGMERGIVWDNVDGGEAPIKENVELVPNKREALNMKRILKLADEANLSMLLVRTNSKYFILKCENYINVWIRTDWKNSMRKPIANKEDWEEVIELKKRIKIYWDYFTEPTDEDKAANQKLQVLKAAKDKESRERKKAMESEEAKGDLHDGEEGYEIAENEQKHRVRV